MNVLCINGSPKPDGNTALALGHLAGEIRNEGFETETVHVGGKAFRGCVGCGACKNRQDRSCIIDDGANEVFAKMYRADAVVVGSPVYYCGIAGNLKTFLDRAFYVAGANGGLMRHKVGASVAVARRSGVIPTLDGLDKYFLISEMIVPGSSYWNGIHGRQPGEAEQDGEGLHTLATLGRNIAWLLKMIRHSSGSVESPRPLDKVWTHFIR